MITKTRFVEYMTCHKKAWMSANMPWMRKFSAVSNQLARTGNVVGELAKGLFGPSADAFALRQDGSLDVEAMALKTMESIFKGEETVCDAAFCTYNGSRLTGFCICDILHKENGGYAVYEVKSSRITVNEKYIWDLAYQDLVLSRKGIVPVAFYSVVLNRDYIWDGKKDSTGRPVYDLQKLFVITDLTDEVVKYRGTLGDADRDVNAAIRVKEEPRTVLCENCMNCDFYDYCKNQLCLDKHSIMTLYGYPLSKKIELFNNGVWNLRGFSRTQEGKKVFNEKTPAAKIRQHQMVAGTMFHGAPEPMIDKAALRSFIDSLGEDSFCCLDFETTRFPLPTVMGTKPYQQIPFMYSFDIMHERTVLQHMEFIADENDPDVVRHFAENLVHDVPAGRAVLVYGAGSKKACLLELASMYHDLADRLLQIERSMVDLQMVFKRGHYYDSAMHGDFSLKSVLKALYPDWRPFDFRILEADLDGTETREVLFERCDTVNEAMFWIVSKLKEDSGWNEIREMMAEDLPFDDSIFDQIDFTSSL